jgi:hypothetical protein
MKAPATETIPLENLMVDLVNPRHVPQPSQREALATIAHDQGVKLANLAEDIAEKGLNPGELPLVTPAEEGGLFFVLEGNRRIAALKLMSSPHLLSSIGLPRNLTDRFKVLHRSFGGVLPSQIMCAVLSREDANHWIHLKHTGENDGVGIVSWDGRARQRFRGSSPALQAVELAESSDLLDDGTRRNLPKIAITNIERVLGTPQARHLLGLDVKNGQLILLSPEESLARLVMLVEEVANKKVKVTNLDSRDQRVEYARSLARRPLAPPVRPGGSPAKEAPTTSSSTPGVGTGVRRISPDRTMLIPKTCRLRIAQARVNKIYNELQKINVKDYVNCCAVMFRVFIELSADHYAKRNTISLKVTPKLNAKSGQKPRDMSLREKIKAIAQYMEDHGTLDREQLRGVRSLYANRDHVLSVDSLNAYVHNMHYNPTPTDLKANWDSVQSFVEGLWAL